MKPQTGQFRTILLVSISLLVGVLTWVLVEEYVGTEAWDHKYYWIVSYPILLITSFMLAIIDVTKKWLWGILPLLAQACYVFLTASEGANLLPLTVVFYLILLAPALVASHLGAWAGNKYFGA